MQINAMPAALIAIRAAKTFFQTVVASLGLDTVVDRVTIPGKYVVIGALIAAGISAFTNALSDLEARFTARFKAPEVDEGGRDYVAE